MNSLNNKLDLLPVVFSLGFVLLLFLLCAALAARFFNRGRAGFFSKMKKGKVAFEKSRLKIVDQQFLDPRRKLFLIEVDTQPFLICLTAEKMHCFPVHSNPPFEILEEHEKM